MGADNVLIIGSGGREHAICWKLSQSPDIANIYIAPGNIGIEAVDKVEIVKLNIKNHSEVATWCLDKNVKLVVVGPEDPLADGIADCLTAEGKREPSTVFNKDLFSAASNFFLFLGILCFGPSKQAAQIESDKEWAKKFMKRHDIPTARFGSFQSAQEAKKFILSATYPALVVKASGLAAGKGVVVASDREEASKAVDDILTQKKFGEAGDTVVIEELLEGEEVSVSFFKIIKTSDKFKNLKKKNFFLVVSFY